MEIKSSKKLVEEALKSINTLSPKDALKQFTDNNCNLIDLRDIRELQNQGKIDKAHHIPRGMLEFWIDPNSSYFKSGKIDIDKPMILFCAGGLRSALATKTLLDMGFKNVSHIDGGFASMKHNGFKVV
tara:strand:+ start:149 stop:532 length:384 start_codon:yes stop_codon:yes gene_type:complete